MPLVDLVGWTVGALLVLALAGLLVVLFAVPFIYQIIKDRLLP